MNESGMDNSDRNFGLVCVANRFCDSKAEIL